jgi:tetratricopeptide (TPR) repeat protein
MIAGRSMAAPPEQRPRTSRSRRRGTRVGKYSPLCWSLAAAMALVIQLPRISSAAEPGAETGSPQLGLRDATSGPGDERVVELNEEGSELYAAGDYRRAAERFLQAYAVDQDPNLLFNVASCYEGLGDLDAALEKYRAFLADPAAEAEGRPRAEAAIERLTAELAERQAAKPPPAPIIAPAPRVAPALEEAPRTPAWIPWVGLGGGAALGVLGATLYAMGAADHADVTDAPGYGDDARVAQMTRSQANALVSSGNTKKAFGMTSASVGGALAVASVAWWLIDPHTEAKTGGKVDLALSGAAAQLTLKGSF